MNTRGDRSPGEGSPKPAPRRAPAGILGVTRYGLWQLARLDQVRENLAAGVVEVEKTLVFDTTHSGGPLALRQRGAGPHLDRRLLTLHLLLAVSAPP